jgi:hypothetical protein
MLGRVDGLRVVMIGLAVGGVEGSRVATTGELEGNLLDV